MVLSSSILTQQKLTKADKVIDFYANVTFKVPVLVLINEFCVAKFQHLVQTSDSKVIKSEQNEKV